MDSRAIVCCLVTIYAVRTPSLKHNRHGHNIIR